MFVCVCVSVSAFPCVTVSVVCVCECFVVGFLFAIRHAGPELCEGVAFVCVCLCGCGCGDVRCLFDLRGEILVLGWKQVARDCGVVIRRNWRRVAGGFCIQSVALFKLHAVAFFPRPVSGRLFPAWLQFDMLIVHY